MVRFASGLLTNISSLSNNDFTNSGGGALLFKSSFLLVNYLNAVRIGLGYA